MNKAALLTFISHKYFSFLFSFPRLCIENPSTLCTYFVCSNSKQSRKNVFRRSGRLYSNLCPLKKGFVPVTTFLIEIVFDVEGASALVKFLRFTTSMSLSSVGLRIKSNKLSICNRSFSNHSNLIKHYK